MSVLFLNKIKIVYSKLNNFNDECLVNPPQEYVTKKENITTDYLESESDVSTIYDNYISYHKINIPNTELINSYDNNYPLYLYTNIYDFNDLEDEFNNVKIINSYNNIFKIIRNNNIKSITIPPFGAGTFNFHIEDFALISVNEINKHIRLNPYIKKITLITDSYQNYNIYQKILNDKIIKMIKKND